MKGLYVLVIVEGSNADGLYVVRSKHADPITVKYSEVQDVEIVRAVVFLEYVDKRAEHEQEELRVQSLPYSFLTQRLYVLGGPEKPDARFVDNVLQRNGQRGISKISLDQLGAKVKYAERLDYDLPASTNPSSKRKSERAEPQASKRGSLAALSSQRSSKISRSGSRTLGKGIKATEVNSCVFLACCFVL